jgi:VRR-NUC domain-containing protein
MTESETQVAEALKAAGWNVRHGGWPDFLCWRDEPDGTRKVMGVEVKRGEDFLKENQDENHDLLLSAGMPVYVARSPHEVSQFMGQNAVREYAAECVHVFNEARIHLEVLLKSIESKQAALDRYYGQLEGLAKQSVQKLTKTLRRKRTT